MVTRRDVTAADAIEAERRAEVGQAVDEKDSRDPGAVVEEADEGASDEHATLHADENGGIGAGELARRNDFLDQSVDGGPVHGGADAGDERHGVEMPELKMAAPGDIRGR